MSDKNKNLLLRIASALVLLPLVLFLLYKGGYWTAVLLGVAAAACASEYVTITLKGLNTIGWVAVGCAAVMPILPVWKPYEAAALVCGVLGVILFSGWAYHLVKGPLAEAQMRTGHLVTAVVYAGGGLCSLSATRNLPDGMWWVVCALAITWMNDTSAYFAGRFLGRHKLYPEVSPNKTWEGFFGGMAGSIGALFITRGFFFDRLTVIDCLLMGTLAGILGPAGDLCESMLKRAYGVKDSGYLIPGHGGILDRIDALLFNAPMVLLYAQFVHAALS